MLRALLLAGPLCLPLSSAQGDSAAAAPLIGAAAQGNLVVVKQLVEPADGAEPADIDGRNNFGDTALHTAAIEGHADVVEYLLEHNSNANTVRSRPLRTHQPAARRTRAAAAVRARGPASSHDRRSEWL
jgi:ankyrin repeat protein